MSIEPSEAERYQALYKLPERNITTPGGDTVAWGRRKHCTEIRLDCATAPTGSKLYAIQALQAAVATLNGRKRPEVKDWHRWFIFRLRDENLPELHRAVLGIATGEQRAAAAYCRQAEGILTDALEEIRAMDRARVSSLEAA